MAQQDCVGAVGELTRVLDQDQEIISETLLMLQVCYQALDQSSTWANFLKRCVEENTGSAPELLLTDIIEREQGPEVAQEYINQQLRQHLTICMFHRLMNFHLSDAEGDFAKESIQTLRDIVGEWIHTKPQYGCQKYGFIAYSLY